jgi:predicted choloylglycine hydrolase
MPALMPVYRRLVRLAGDGDLAARFLSTWCPPAYLGGCSLAACGAGGKATLVRNYDLSPDLNEGLLLRSEWTGMPVMGMIEFLWGLSDGINGAGLSVALAFGGRHDVAPGIGITAILRCVLETCRTVDESLDVLRRVPSHMAYNVVLADRHGATAMIEIYPGGGSRCCEPAIATNHQRDAEGDHALIQSSPGRLAHLGDLLAGGIDPASLGDAFLAEPLYQRNFAEAAGTLFTAVYEPMTASLVLRWPGEDWVQSLDRFTEGRREITYQQTASDASAASWSTDGVTPDLVRAIRPFLPPDPARRLASWDEDARRGAVDWTEFGRILARWGANPAPSTCSEARFS